MEQTVDMTAKTMREATVYEPGLLYSTDRGVHTSVQAGRAARAKYMRSYRAQKTKAQKQEIYQSRTKREPDLAKRRERSRKRTAKCREKKKHLLSGRTPGIPELSMAFPGFPFPDCTTSHLKHLETTCPETQPGGEVPMECIESVATGSDHTPGNTNSQEHSCNGIHCKYEFVEFVQRTIVLVQQYFS